VELERGAEGLPQVALALLVVNAVSYAALVVLNLARAVRFPASVHADLVDHQRGVGFFTAVAGTAVLGVQLVVLLRVYTLAILRWAVAIVLWAVLIYAVFTAFTVKQPTRCVRGAAGRLRGSGSRCRMWTRERPRGSSDTRCSLFSAEGGC